MYIYRLKTVCLKEVKTMNIKLLIETQYVKNSTYRTKIVKTLDGGVKIPTQISRDVGIRTNHISKVLHDLKSKDIVICLNENDRKGRLYKLTEKGKKINQYIKEEKK